jgi:putative ABC transport system ATP-binding protein
MGLKIIAELNEVSKFYGTGSGRVAALDRVSLSLENGGVYVLVGPSGSGKSTILHLLGCIDKQDSGKIIIGGIDTTLMSLEKLTPLRRDKIGFVFQSFNLIPVLTAYENIELPLLFKGLEKSLIKSRVNDVLDKVGLYDRKHHYPRQLSGGQQQRVAIARAIVGKPDLILADEPTANLDSKTGGRILDLLLDVSQNENRSVLVASHDTDVLERISRIVRILDGKILID